METRIQHRAICPACFGEWAVKGDAIVDHGYTLQWSYRSGKCAGAGRSHFGTPAGRDEAAAIAAGLRTFAANNDKAADDVQSGAAPVIRRDGTPRTDAPQHVRDYAAQSMRGNSAGARAHAEMIDARVAAWAPAEPVAVVVEAKGGPVVHLAATVYGFKHAADCNMSARAAQKFMGRTTTDAAAVTCTRCLARIAERAARAAKA